MTEEIFDVCDENDNVIGTAPRSEVHRCKLLHRAVHIWVWNSDGELLLQKRTETKDEFPGCFTSSASGHVDSGESYEAAAIRELKEELQLQGELIPGDNLIGSESTAYEHTVLYHLQTDAPPVPDPGEIADVVFLSTAQIAEMLERSPETFTPPFRMLFQAWWEKECAEQEQLFRDVPAFLNSDDAEEGRKG